MLYHCQQHKFIIEEFLCNTKYCYFVNSDIYLNNTHKMYCCVPIATMVIQTCHNILFTYTALLVKFLYWLKFGIQQL